MIDSAVVSSSERGSREAGLAMGRGIRERLRGARADALVLFASPRHDYPDLIAALREACEPELLVGCSTAGEFTAERHGDGFACAVALRSDEIQFAAGVGRGLRAHRDAAAAQLAASFKGTAASPRRATALVLTDALAGQADHFVEKLTHLTAGSHRFFGGGAGDDARFSKTHVFFGDEVATDAAVALEMVTNKPIGIGVRHGWRPATRGMRVTQAEGTALVSVDAAPAIEAFREHATATRQKFDEANPIPFFLHNIVGVDTGRGQKLRVPLAVNPDGSIACATEVPEGTTAHIMRTTARSAADAALEATRDAAAQLGGHKPRVAFLFDCVATRLRLGAEFGTELRSVTDTLPGAELVGFNSYGQIARVDGQFSGFHNCTAVVCVLPE